MGYKGLPYSWSLPMLISLGYTILRLFSRNGGWTDRAARSAGIASVVLAVLVLAPVAKCSYDHAVISAHDKQQAAEQAQKDVKALQAADEAERQRQADFGQSQDRLASAAASAAAADPTAAAKPVGPVSRSYYDNLPEKRR